MGALLEQYKSSPLFQELNSRLGDLVTEPKATAHDKQVALDALDTQKEQRFGVAEPEWPDQATFEQTVAGTTRKRDLDTLTTQRQQTFTDVQKARETEQALHPPGPSLFQRSVDLFNRVFGGDTALSQEQTPSPVTPQRLERDAVRGTTPVLPPKTPLPAPPLAPAPSQAGPVELDPLIERYAAQHQVPASLVRAVIRQESNFDPRAVSKVGAKGLMQLMDQTASDMEVADPFDPEQNIAGGTKYLAMLLKRYGGDRERALAAYNFGMGNVEAGHPLPNETKKYVQNVLRFAGDERFQTAPLPVIQPGPQVVQASVLPTDILSSTAPPRAEPTPDTPVLMPGLEGVGDKMQAFHDTQASSPAALPLPEGTSPQVRRMLTPQDLVPTGLDRYARGPAEPSFLERALFRPAEAVTVGLLGTGPTKFMDWLEARINQVGRATGTNTEWTGPLFRDMTTLTRKIAEHQPVDQNWVESIYQRIAEAPVNDLPKIAMFTRMLGPVLGFAGLNAVEGAEQGTKEAIIEGLKGALTGGAFKGLEGLGMGQRMLGGGTLGVAQSAAEGVTDPAELAASGVTMAALSAPGPVKGETFRQRFTSGYGPAPAAPQGSNVFEALGVDPNRADLSTVTQAFKDRANAIQRETMHATTDQARLAAIDRFAKLTKTFRAAEQILGKTRTERPPVDPGSVGQVRRLLPEPPLQAGSADALARLTVLTPDEVATRAADRVPNNLATKTGEAPRLLKKPVAPEDIYDPTVRPPIPPPDAEADALAKAGSAAGLQRRAEPPKPDTLVPDELSIRPMGERRLIKQPPAAVAPASVKPMAEPEADALAKIRPSHKPTPSDVAPTTTTDMTATEAKASIPETLTTKTGPPTVTKKDVSVEQLQALARHKQVEDILGGIAQQMTGKPRLEVLSPSERKIVAKRLEEMPAPESQPTSSPALTPETVREDQTSAVPATVKTPPPASARSVSLDAVGPEPVPPSRTTRPVTQSIPTPDAMSPEMREAMEADPFDVTPTASSPVKKSEVPRPTREVANKANLPISATKQDVASLPGQLAPVDTAAHEAATSPHNDLTEPTQPMKEAGNYKKGHVTIGGLPISIENPQGSIRSGTDAKGKPWSVEMKSHYGYLKGTVGKDKDHIDVFVKPGTPQDYAGPVYVVDQKNPSTNRFDEHKTILGASSLEEAKRLYHENYAKNWQGLQSITKFSMPEFKEWLKSGETKKPAVDYTPTRDVATYDKGETFPPERQPLGLTPDTLPVAKAQAPPPPPREIGVPSPTVGKRPLSGRDVTPDEASLFSRAAKEPEAEQGRFLSRAPGQSANKTPARTGGEEWPPLNPARRRRFRDWTPEERAAFLRTATPAYTSAPAVDTGVVFADSSAKTSQETLRSLAVREHVKPLGRVLSTATTAFQRAIGIHPRAVFRGFDVNMDLEGINVDAATAGRADTKGQQIFVNPHLPVALADFRVQRGSRQPQERARLVANDLLDTVIHEVTHQQVSGHGPEFASRLRSNYVILRPIRTQVQRQLMQLLEARYGDRSLLDQLSRDNADRQADVRRSLQPHQKRAEGRPGNDPGDGAPDSGSGRDRPPTALPARSRESAGVPRPRGASVSQASGVERDRSRIDPATYRSTGFSSDRDLPADASIHAAPQQARHRPVPSMPRIPVDPIMGKPAKPITDILMDVTAGTGQKVTTAKQPRGAGGYYDPSSTVATIKYSGNLDTTAHELSHALDDKFGIVADWAQQATSPYDAELRPFAEHGSMELTGPRSRPQYVRAEGVAEWLRAWIVNPKAAEQAAPTFAQFALGKLDQPTRKALTQFSDDIRTFAGSTAHGKIMANVQWDAPETRLTDWVTGRSATNGPGFRLTWVDTAKAELLDRLHPYMKAIDYARQQRGWQEKPLPKNDPQLLARLYMGIHAKMDSIFEKGMIDAHGQRVTNGGLEWLMDPLDKKHLNAEMQETASYMIAQRTLEKAQQLNKTRISGIGAGIESDLDVAKQRLQELSQDPKKLARLEEAASRYRQWAEANLRYLRDKGRISSEQFEAIRQHNAFYVAMQRLLEVHPGEELVTLIPKSAGGAKLGSAKQPIQAFEGSTKTIKNPYSTLMDATYRAVREADRNEVLRNFRDLLTSDRRMYEGTPEDLASVGRQAKEGEAHTIPIFKNGQKEIWQFHPDVYAALKAVDDTAMQLPKFLELFTYPARIMRAGITKMPPFALRNLIRDAFQRTVVSTNGSKPWDSLKVYSKAEKEGLALSGGDQAGYYYRDDRDYQTAMKEGMTRLTAQQNVIVAAPGKLARAYSDIIESGEQQGRLSEYRRAFEKAKADGLDDYNASLKAAGDARDLLDFAIAGNTMRVVNRFVPFTNAAIQGLRIAGTRLMENPVAVGARWFVWVATPTLLNYFWNHAHGDIEEYRALPAYQRDLFWNLKLGPDLWLATPKPFEMGAAATSLERMVDSAMGNDHAFEGHWRSLATSFLPVDEQALFGPLQSIGSAVANYDFFRDKPIVPRHEENLDLNLRRTDRASRLGQVLQQAIGVDARKIDFVVENQLGYLGKYATAASDLGRKDRIGFSASSTGVLRPDPVESALDVKWVHDTAVERGALATKDWKQFQEIKNAYHQADGATQREALGIKVRAAAKTLRAQWERKPPRPDADKTLRRKRLLEGGPDPVLEAMGISE